MSTLLKYSLPTNKSKVFSRVEGVLMVEGLESFLDSLGLCHKTASLKLFYSELLEAIAHLDFELCGRLLVEAIGHLF